MTKRGNVADGDADEPETAAYIADMTAGLARLARAAQLGVLAYLLEMAATEARSGMRDEDGETGPPGAIRRLD
jgi:hypothetical protein